MLKDKKIHIIGIGGIGMSAIAKILHKTGYEVSGSSNVNNCQVEQMQKMGIGINIGHRLENVLEKDVVIYSTAIDKNNIEILTAKKEKKILLNRQELFPLIFKDKKNIAVSGTHGKTSTTALISEVLLSSNMEPNILIGAYWDRIKSNELVSDSPYFVIEADESDGSFLGINPFISIVTNIDKDHMDYYKDLDSMEMTYRQFINNTDENGCVFINGDDKRLLEAIKTVSKKIVSFGFNEGNNIFAYDVIYKDNKQHFKVRYFNKELGLFELNIMGQHMVQNSLVAIGVGLFLNLDLDNIKQALKNYCLPSRRMEKKGIFLQKDVIDDYAHHPIEIEKTYSGLVRRYSEVVVVFQPHRYTRTKENYNDLIAVLKKIKIAYILPIYSAGEQPIEGVDSLNIAKHSGHEYVETLNEIKTKIQQLKEPSNAIIFMGAGDITQMASTLASNV